MDKLHKLRVAVNIVVQLVHMSYLTGMTGDKKDQRIPIMMSTSEVERIDNWRGKQAGVPSRSEAIRRLVELGLDAHPL